MINYKSHALVKQYERYLFSGVNLLPNIIESGRGSFVIDVDGNKILDLNAGQFCSIFGHSWPKLNEVFRSQSNKILHTGTNTITRDLFFAAKKMVEICKGMRGKVIFLSTGSEAVECALRFAKSIKKKNGFACFNNGYHGLSLGSQSVTFGGQWSLPKVDMIYSVNLPFFHGLESGEVSKLITQSLADIEKMFHNNHQNIAGFIMEPIVSVGGMIFLPKEYCEGIYDLCKKYNIFLLYDECQTGIGRTGKWFSYQHTRVIPDFLISAKALGAGLPISSVVFNTKTVEFSNTSVNHFSSHQNDPLSSAISLTVINEIQSQDLLKKISQKGKYFLKRLQDLSTKYDFIKNPRGQGLMLGFDIYKPGLSSYIDIGQKFSQDLLGNGVMLQSTCHGKTYRLLPNYLVKMKEIDFFIKQLEKSAKYFSVNIDA